MPPTSPPSSHILILHGKYSVVVISLLCVCLLVLKQENGGSFYLLQKVLRSPNSLLVSKYEQYHVLTLTTALIYLPPPSNSNFWQTYTTNQLLYRFILPKYIHLTYMYMKQSPALASECHGKGVGERRMQNIFPELT